ncbi:MAG: ATP-binding cassette domain-containing protein [Streptosporangiales bacterium]|nr:ATP-binding cassette domain-containing protein [Streptosporangiales bacterium]
MSTHHAQLVASGLAKSYGGRQVLDLRELTAGAGERLGVVGENGAGKSTLLRLLAGEEEPDAGTVALHGSVGYLHQQVRLPLSATIADLVEEALGDLRELELRLEKLSVRLAAEPSTAVADEYADALAEAEARELWTAQVRVDTALSGLGVGDLPRERRLDEASGGQRSRLALADLLVRRPEVLLLDEPTNHLDDAALAYLEEVLGQWSGVVVAVSHDRAFLDAVCTSILDLDPGRDGATRYGGRYTDYLVAKAAERQRWEQAYEQWQDEHNRLERLTRGTVHKIAPNRGPSDNDKFAVKFKGQRVGATVRRRVRDAEQRLKALDEERVQKPPKPVRFRPRSDDGISGGIAVSVREVVVPGRLSVDVFDVVHDTRLLVTGPNGAGKSTLLAVLCGSLAPEHGTVMWRKGVHVGLLAQEVRWDRPERSAVATFAAGRPGAPEEHISALLDVGLLHPRELRTPVGRLSIGQQRRLALAQLLVDDPDVLLLDEPTDHLSLVLVEELEEALTGRRGPVVVVSHDRWLRRRWPGESTAVVSGRLSRP